MVKQSSQEEENFLHYVGMDEYHACMYTTVQQYGRTGTCEQDSHPRLGKVSFDSVRALERYSVELKRLTFNFR